MAAQLLKNPLQCGRPGFDPWVGKIPWRRDRLPTPVFWPGEFHGLYSPWGRKESDRTERLSLRLGVSKQMSIFRICALCKKLVKLCFTFVTLSYINHLYFLNTICSAMFSSVAQSCPTLCNPVHCSMPGLPVHHQLLEFTQSHVHRVGDAIQPSHPLSSPSPPAPNPSQHQGLFQ